MIHPDTRQTDAFIFIIFMVLFSVQSLSFLSVSTRVLSKMFLSEKMLHSASVCPPQSVSEQVLCFSGINRLFSPCSVTTPSVCWLKSPAVFGEELVSVFSCVHVILCLLWSLETRHLQSSSKYYFGSCQSELHCKGMWYERRWGECVVDRRRMWNMDDEDVVEWNVIVWVNTSWWSGWSWWDFSLILRGSFETHTQSCNECMHSF